MSTKFFDDNGNETIEKNAQYQAILRMYFGQPQIRLYTNRGMGPGRMPCWDSLGPNDSDGLNKDGSITGLTRMFGIHGGAIIGNVQTRANETRARIWLAMQGAG